MLLAPLDASPWSSLDKPRNRGQQKGTFQSSERWGKMMLDLFVHEISSWWFQPIWKILVKLGWKWKKLKPPPRICVFDMKQLVVFYLSQLIFFWHHGKCCNSYFKWSFWDTCEIFLGIPDESMVGGFLEVTIVGGVGGCTFVPRKKEPGYFPWNPGCLRGILVSWFMK